MCQVKQEEKANLIIGGGTGEKEKLVNFLISMPNAHLSFRLC